MVFEIRVNDQLSGEQSVSSDHAIVTIEDVNRVLEIGRLLFSVLTEEEIAELQEILKKTSDENEIGNAGVT